MYYTYKDEKFVPCEPRVEWPKNMTSREWLDKSGYYSTHYTFGEIEFQSIVIHHNNDETAFIVLVTPFGNFIHPVYIDSFHDLMTFLRDYAPLFELMAISGNLKTIEEISEKSFYVKHGHSSVFSCRSCEP